MSTTTTDTVLTTPVQAPTPTPAPIPPAQPAKVEAENPVHTASRKLREELAAKGVNVTDEGEEATDTTGTKPGSTELPKETKEAVPKDPPAETKSDKPEAGEEAAEFEGAVLEREDGARWNADAKRWQKADGTFVEGEVPTAEQIAELEAAIPKPIETEEGEVQAQKFVIPGDAQRGEEDLEIEVSDPDVIERLSRLKKDGLRRQEFNRQMEAVNKKQADFKSLEIEITTNPIGFMMDRLVPARRVEIAKALLVEHFDDLVPDIEKFWTDDSERKLALADMKEGLVGARKEVEAATTYQRQAEQVIEAVNSLIPEGVSEEDATDFFYDATTYLETLTKERKQLIDPREVPQLLAKRLARYGFQNGTAAQESESGQEVQPKQTPRVAVARPVSDDAKAIADRAKAKQQRIKVIQVQRSNAAAVSPAGAGAMPIEMPKPPKGATVKEASQWMRQQMTGGKTWAHS